MENKQQKKQKGIGVTIICVANVVLLAGILLTLSAQITNHIEFNNDTNYTLVAVFSLLPPIVGMIIGLLFYLKLFKRWQPKMDVFYQKNIASGAWLWGGITAAVCALLSAAAYLVPFLLDGSFQDMYIFFGGYVLFASGLLSGTAVLIAILKFNPTFIRREAKKKED